jgi:hypothetical protein
MTTATIDGTAETTTRRTPGPRTRPSATYRPNLAEARTHAQTAVNDLAAVTTDAIRTLVPPAVLHPTDAVAYSFDLAEQFLSGLRQICQEIAVAIESGLDGIENRTG